MSTVDCLLSTISLCQKNNKKNQNYYMYAHNSQVEISTSAVKFLSFFLMEKEYILFVTKKEKEKRKTQPANTNKLSSTNCRLW